MRSTAKRERDSTKELISQPLFSFDLYSFVLHLVRSTCKYWYIHFWNGILKLSDNLTWLNKRHNNDKNKHNYLNQARNEILKSWKYIYKLHLMFNLSFQMGKMWFLSDFESAPIVGVRRADRVGYVWNCWSLGLSSHQPVERKTNLFVSCRPATVSQKKEIWGCSANKLT